MTFWGDVVGEAWSQPEPSMAGSPSSSSWFSCTPAAVRTPAIPVLLSAGEKFSSLVDVAKDTPLLSSPLTTRGSLP